ncbi:transmembrane domain-containing protein [Cryptosporidium canis]|uniref:Transmembrane domain-containing protein n=1 Tax=Cryptosporidium canis TaxID=195482 RepID=A0A9D5HUL2_9CRYT|nr:transmembrane domain-containing protein [Cryptosporidium canis]
MSKKLKKSTQKFTLKSENLVNDDIQTPGFVSNGSICSFIGSEYKEVQMNECFKENEEYIRETKGLEDNRGDYFLSRVGEKNTFGDLSSSNEDQADDLIDNNPIFNKTENNVVSSFEFIWSEIRSENVLEKKDVDYFEIDDDILDDRIPKNILNEVYQVPKKLEYLLNFSMLLCFDTILYDLTFLPINSIIAFLKFILLLIIYVANIFMLLVTGKSSYFQNNSMNQKSIVFNYFGINTAYNEHDDKNPRSFQKDIMNEHSKKGIYNDEFIENSSVEFIFEDKPIKSKSLMSIPEYNDRLRFMFHFKSKDDGFLGKNNHLFPQIRNHIHSYRMNDQKSSLEESELQSVPASYIFYDEINNDFIEAKNNEDSQPSFNRGIGWYFRLTVIELTDLSRFMVLFLSIYIFSRLDISFFYHYFRGQGLLKLYVIFNMLEIFEKLFRSFGRDLIDTYLESIIQMFSSIGFVEGKYEKEQISSNFTNLLLDTLSKYFLVIVYLLIHCIIHMIRGLALNISLNSSEYTMFLIVITNNFAEIKSTVFKTYHSISLFTISCSDTIERFQLLYDGCILFIRMYSNARLYTNSIYSSVIIWVVSVYIVEIIVDWFKHSFLVKFNKINSDCYCSYLDTLIGDVLLSRGSKQAYQYLTIDYIKKNVEENDSNDKLVNRNSWNYVKSSQLFNKSNSNGSLNRQGTFSLIKGNTIGLEADVSLNQNKEIKIKKIQYSFQRN